MRPVRLLSLLLLLLALAMAGSPASATTVLRQGIDSLTDGADVVVRGVVEQVSGHVEREGNPFRIAILRVDETLAGQAPARVAVRLPGGATVDGLPRLAAGVPELLEGDEVVLFLARLSPDLASRPCVPAGGDLAGPRGRVSPAGGPPPRDQWMPISLAVGTYRVERSAEGVRAVHDAAARGMAAVGPEPGGGDAPDAIGLSALATRVTARRAQQGRP